MNRTRCDDLPGLVDWRNRWTDRSSHGSVSGRGERCGRFVKYARLNAALTPAAGRALLQALLRAMYVSTASAFEIATQVPLDTLTVPPAILKYFAYVVEADGFWLLDIEAAFADLGVAAFW